MRFQTQRLLRPGFETLPSHCWHWCVLASSLLAVLSPSTQAEPLHAEHLLAPDRIVNIAIEIPEKDWLSLCRQSRDFRMAFADPTAKPFTYFKGDIAIDGVKIASVGIRKKGFIGSLDDRYPSLKVKFDEYFAQNPVKGLDVLTLNNNKQDPALVSQFLTYRLFNAAGLHAPRVSFARVTVNGEYLGIYSNVESIGKQFLNQRFGNDSGHLYEGTLTDFYPSAVHKLEVKNNQKKHDGRKLQRIAEILASKQELPLEEVEQLVDVEYFLRFWALESLIGFWDGYANNQNNYWVYDNPRNGKFYFMPWGADGAFLGTRGPFGFFNNRAPTSVYAEAMLANRLFHTPGVAERYRDAMLDLLDSVWHEDELLGMVDLLGVLLSDHLHERQRNAPRAMDSIRRFISSRRETILKEFEDWPVAVPAEPRKPMYTVEVGTAQGTFATHWHETPNDQATEPGAAEIVLVLDGEVVAFKEMGASAQIAQFPRFPMGFGREPGPGGGPGGPPRGRPGEEPRPQTQRESPKDAAEGAADRLQPVLRPGPGDPPGGRPGRAPFGGGPFGQIEPPATVVLSGIRASDSKKLTLTLSLNRDTFAASAGKTVPIHGTLAEGEGGFNFFNPFGGRTVSGELKLEKAGITPGAPVAGEFQVKIAETRGGFMAGRAGPGGAGPGGPGRGANRPPEPNRPE